MIKPANDINNLLYEFKYNKLTIIFAIIISIISYFTWQYSVGIMVWALYLCVTVMLIGVTCIPGWHIIFSAFLSLMLSIGAISCFINNFWQTLFLQFEDTNEVYKLALAIKESAIRYPEFGSIFIGLMFLLLFWAHPNPEGEKYIAYNPMKVLEYRANNPVKFHKFSKKAVIFLAASFIGGKAIATLATWYFLYSIVKFLYYDTCVRGNDATPKKFLSYLIVYCIIAFSYGIFVTDKTPVDALIGIIMMTP